MADKQQLQEQAPASAKPGERLLKPLRADIKVAANGTVTAIRHWPDTPVELRPGLERAIQRWTFLPAADKGTAVDSATRLSVWTTAVKRGSGYALQVEKTELTTAWYDYSEKFLAPRYPRGMAWSNREASVLFLLKFGKDGAENTILSAAVNGHVAKGRDAFVKAGSEVVTQWPFKVLEWDGVRYAKQACVPVEFSLSRQHQAQDAPDDSDLCRNMPGSDYEDSDEEIRLAADVRGQML